MERHTITKMGKKKTKSITNIISYTLLGIGSLIMLAPFVWMVSTSLKEPGAIFTYPPEWLPQSQIMVNYKEKEYGLYMITINGVKEKVIKIKVSKDDTQVMIYRDNKITKGIIHVSDKDLKPYKKIQFQWKNYVKAWNAVPFGRFFINSIIVSVCVTFGSVLTSSLAAYSFARIKFAGRDKLFMGYLATMMIPFPVTMIPVFILITKFLGWGDTLKALIIPGIFTAYGTFMLRQFFLTIPKELEEAASIDGCGKLRIYWKIILPLSKPALATLSTFTFMGVWNDFMWPLIIMKSSEKMTLPVGLNSFQGQYYTEWTLLMAASVIVLMPVILLYIFNQRFFIKGIAMTGIKG